MITLAYVHAQQQLEDAEPEPRQEHPVFHFDFSPEKYEVREDLEEILNHQLGQFETQIGYLTGTSSIAARFSTLLKTAYRKTAMQASAALLKRNYSNILSLKEKH